MSGEATYLDLCTQVYEISKPTAPEDALAFYRSYADEAGGVILEPMCGTGRFLLPLAKDGYKIEGSDASEQMLDVLKRKAEQMRLKVNIWKSAASEIPDNKLYSLIFIPSGSFGLITDPDELSKTLKSFYEHLADGDICSSVARYELIDKNKLLQTEIEEYKIKIYEPQSLLELLDGTGFRDVKIVKAFDRETSPGDNDESIVYQFTK
ncbi:MAG: class I SAM-dependent methyltransferase [Chlamydiota bacterium]